MIIVKLSIKELEQHKACKEGIALFREWFGESVEREFDPLTQVMLAKSDAKHFYQWACDRGIAPRYNLPKANLEGADLRSADLRSADLRSANLSGANLSGADLYGAKHNEYTRWPEGFDKSRLT